jgi:hypothetical protein
MNNLTDKRNLLGRGELNAILYKFKRYYNDLNKTKLDKLKRINELKEITAQTGQKINVYNSYKEIHLEKEKIAIRDIERVLESKEEVEARIIQLNNKTDELKVNLKDEQEYTNTLLYMINTEKQQLEKLNERLVTSQEKIIAVKHSKVNFSANDETHKKKKHNADVVKRQIRAEITKLEEIIAYQDHTLSEMNLKVEKKDESIKTLRKSLEIKNKELQNQVLTSKDKIEKNILLYEEQLKNKTALEFKYITIILGLDILKRYFIDLFKHGESINSQLILNTADYKTFISGAYSVVDENDREIFSTDNTANKNTTKAIIKLDDLKEKFKGLNLDLDSMIDFYSKLINKTSLYRQNMNLYNHKIITLEGVKENSTKLVKRIISERFKEFTELIKDNPKFNGFMLNYINMIKSSVPTRRVKHIDPPETPTIYSDFYLKCMDQVSEFKSYYEFTLINFKSMVKNCEDQNMITSIKTTQKLIKNKIMKEYLNFSKLNKENYTKAIFDVLDKREPNTDNEHKQLRLFIENSKNREDFFDIKLDYQHILYYWFNHIDNITESLREVTKTINMCKGMKTKSKRTLKFDTKIEGKFF